VLGRLIFAALWLTATTLPVKPDAELPERAPGTVGAKLRPLSGRAVSRAQDRAAAW